LSPDSRAAGSVDCQIRKSVTLTLHWLFGRGSRRTIHNVWAASGESKKYYISFLDEVSLELDLHRIILLAILICQPEGGQNILCFCPHAVNESNYLALITLFSEACGLAESFKEADPLLPLIRLALGKLIWQCNLISRHVKKRSYQSTAATM